MTGRLLFAACFAVAGAGHWALLPMSDTGVAGAEGSQGADTLSLVAVDASLSALVEAWQQPPNVAPQPQPAPQPQMPDALPTTSPAPQPMALSIPQARVDLPPERPDAPFLESSSPQLSQAARSLPAASVDAPPPPEPAPDLAPALPASASTTTPRASLSGMPVLQPLNAQQDETAFTAPQAPVPPPPPPAPVISEPPTIPAPPRRPADLVTQRRPAPQPPAPVQASRPPSQPAPATAARTASGGDSGATAGSNRQSVDAGGAAQQADALATWGGRIRAQIERQRGRVSGRGRVTLLLRVAASGRLQSVRIAQGSGNDRIDSAAVSAAGRGSFPRAPEILGSGARDFRITLRFGR